jgi:hypothetical protein
MQERENEGCCFMNKGHVLYCILSAASILVKAVYIYCCCPSPPSSSLAQISSAPSSIKASQQLFASTFASCKRLVIDHRKYFVDSRPQTPERNLVLTWTWISELWIWNWWKMAGSTWLVFQLRVPRCGSCSLIPSRKVNVSLKKGLQFMWPFGQQISQTI